ncbi:MAG: nicotinamide-nucleotide amidohydrolase family protein [Brachybacterium sp.]|nr:nicotinamide-nucleotide amidohydrolase family protein [Brachybacterium sp.]MDN5900966.1 nicotinamide-nucleotide amidohydrolase family protein [Brachybacterium sp.]
MADAGGAPRDDSPATVPHADPAGVIRRAAERGWSLSTAESLTAGAVVARLVDVPGASAVIAGGAACYSLQAKSRVLGVDAARLAATGAVTAEVAAAMAEGALSLYLTDLAVSTTGVAGPGPDERGVPEGTVVLGLARRDRPTLTRELRLSGGRSRIRALAVDAAIRMLRAALEE